MSIDRDVLAEALSGYFIMVDSPESSDNHKKYLDQKSLFLLIVQQTNLFETFKPENVLISFFNIFDRIFVWLVDKSLILY
jgi:hypothetical protein